MSDMVRLANGEEIPKYLVDALDGFDTVWPGASFVGARPAIVSVILNEMQIHMVDHIHQTLVNELKMSEDEAKTFSIRLARRLVR